MCSALGSSSELTLFPGLGWYSFGFALEPFELVCNGVALPIGLQFSPCDNFSQLMIGANANIIAGTGTCGPQQLGWSWERQ